MEILIKSSRNLKEQEWISYIDSFNQVFQKNFQKEYFEQKYLNTIDLHSYHSILKEEERIVGSCSVIPFNYLFENRQIKIGLAVDVFILEEYRSDPLALLRMYKKLKKKLIEENIFCVLAVPNDKVYSYWKNVVKWKDIGPLDYYVLPIKAGNVLHKMNSALNIFSQKAVYLSILLSRIFNSVANSFPIRIDRSESFLEKQRYTSDHHIVRKDNVFFSYRIITEEAGEVACYLIDFYNQDSKKKDSQTLVKAVNHIRKKEKIDIIIFVGKLSFFQLLLIKVPRKFEPKPLNLTIDILFPENFDNPNMLLEIANWDFGLFNYDVR